VQSSSRVRPQKDNLSERKLEALIDELGCGYYDFAPSVIEKVVVADVTVTAKKRK